LEKQHLTQLRFLCTKYIPCFHYWQFHTSSKEQLTTALRTLRISTWCNRSRVLGRLCLKSTDCHDDNFDEVQRDVLTGHGPQLNQSFINYNPLYKCQALVTSILNTVYSTSTVRSHQAEILSVWRAVVSFCLGSDWSRNQLFQGVWRIKNKSWLLW